MQALALVFVAVLLAGCRERPVDAPPPAPSASAEAPREPPHVERARCTDRRAHCTAVTGRVLYVEAVDPDGDGDAHYVLAGGDVTASGISVIDVERAMRPRRLPRRGELVSAAGPVYRGSHGQLQIQAVEINYQR